MILDMGGIDIRYNAPGRQHEGAAGRGLRRRLRGQRRPQGQGARRSPAARRPRPTSTSASTGSSRWPSDTSTRSASACSSSASATRPWTAAAPRAGWAARTSRSWPAGPAATSRPRPGSWRTPRRSRSRSSSTTPPSRSCVEKGRLKGMMFDQLEWSPDEKGQLTKSKVVDTVFIPADDVILAIGQEASFPWIERDIGIEFDEVGHAGGRQGHPPGDAARASSSAATPPGARRTSSGRWPTATQAAISIDNHCQGVSLTERPRPGMNLVSQKMGIHEWSYSNDYDPAKRQKMKHVDLAERFAKLDRRGRDGLRRRADRARGGTLPQLRHPDGVRRAQVHRVRRLHRHLPGALPDHHARRRGAAAAAAPDGAGAEPEAGHLRLGWTAADQAGDGEGRGPLRALRAVRRALPDGGVGHAEVRARPSLCGQAGRTERPGPRPCKRPDAAPRK